MEPAVSVILKSYNHEKYVGESISSILGQTFDDFEFLVLDDCSTDDTLLRVQNFSDSRLTVRSLSRNGGVSNAMNALLDQARGRYVAILNSDDVASPDRLARQVEYLEANPVALALFTTVNFIDDDGRPLDQAQLSTSPLGSSAESAFRRPLTFPDFRRSTWLRQFWTGNCLCAPSAMVRREAFRATGPYDRRLTNLQDLDMWIRLASLGELHVIDERLTSFRIRANNANLSAPNRDSVLRSHFEFSQILRRFVSLPRNLIEETFADEIATLEIAPTANTSLLLSGLAMATPTHSHSLFGLQLLFDSAATDEDFDRLRGIAGKADLFGIGDRQNVVDVETKLTIRDEYISALKASNSWRVTAPLRAVSSLFRKTP